VVTEIRYDTRVEARVHHRDGRDSEVPLDQIGGYISEKENPENARQIDWITVELPELRRFRGLKFVDTPGLESALLTTRKPRWTGCRMSDSRWWPSASTRPFRSAISNC
jgi:hypothetical protein